MDVIGVMFTNLAIIVWGYHIVTCSKPFESYVQSDANGFARYVWFSYNQSIAIRSMLPDQLAMADSSGILARISAVSGISVAFSQALRGTHPSIVLPYFSYFPWHALWLSGIMWHQSHPGSWSLQDGARDVNVGEHGPPWILMTDPWCWYISISISIYIYIAYYNP